MEGIIYLLMTFVPIVFGMTVVVVVFDVVFSWLGLE